MLKKISISLLVYISLSACANDSQEKNKESALIDYKNPKNICYGRLTITIPKEAEIDYGLSSYDGIDIEFDENINSYQKYDKFVNNKISELKKSIHETESSLFHQNISFPIGGNVSHIVVFRATPYTRDMYDIEAYIYLPLKNKMLILKGGSADAYLQSGVKDVKDTISNIKFKKTNVSGTCFNGFYIEDYDDKKIFMSEIFFSFPSYPEVRVSIDNRSRLTSDEDLIKYSNSNLYKIPVTERAMVNIDEINVGTKKIDLMSGEEYSHHITSTLSFNRGYEDIIWQHLGKLDNIKKSYVRYDLSSKNQNGSEIDALVDQKRVVELGEFILNNLKNNDK